MKYLLVLLIFLFTFISISQERYHRDKTTIDLYDTIVYLRFDMKPLNGIVYGEFGEFGNFIDGKKDGLHRRWYENGKLEEESNYINNSLTGLYKRWNEDGLLYWE